MCLHKSRAQWLFPDDQLLAEMKVERYCGVQLSDHLGVLVVMDEHPMRDIEFIEDIVGPSRGGRHASIF